MTALYYTAGVLIFAFAILASIGLHEFGHLIPAKRFGVRVSQWFIGMGPTVFSRKVGETEYGLKAFPVGGFVRILGMLPPAKGDPEGRLRPSNTGLFTQLISDARAAALDEVRPEDRDRLFYQRAWWRKVIVMAGGPTVNLLIAFVIFWGIFATFGNPADAKHVPVVDAVSACVVPGGQSGRVCTKDEVRDHPTPAYTSGLRDGDRFVSLNGTRITSWDQLSKLIRANGDNTAVLVIERDGKQQTVTTKTMVTPRPVSGTDPTMKPVGFLGVTPQVELATGGPVYTLQEMGGMTVNVVHGIAKLPAGVYGVAKSLVGLQERDPNGPISVVGGGRLAGEVAADHRFDVESKLVQLFSMIAAFNLFIGMFNFVPLLPLDGGHIAGALWEGLRRGWARLRRRADPGYVDVAKMLPVAYVVFAAFIVMAVVLITADIFIPVHLPAE